VRVHLAQGTPGSTEEQDAAASRDSCAAPAARGMGRPHAVPSPAPAHELLQQPHMLTPQSCLQASTSASAAPATPPQLPPDLLPWHIPSSISRLYASCASAGPGSDPSGSSSTLICNRACNNGGSSSTSSSSSWVATRGATTITKTGVPNPRPEVEQALSTHQVSRGRAITGPEHASGEPGARDHRARASCPGMPACINSVSLGGLRLLPIRMCAPSFVSSPLRIQCSRGSLQGCA